MDYSEPPGFQVGIFDAVKGNRSMVVLGEQSTMYECRVLYIGSAPPIETLKGMDALQEPLRQRYPVNLDDVEGIDALIRVLPTALEVQYITSGQVIQFPLDRLSICAGVRAVNVTDGTTGETVRQFVPLNTVQPDSNHPAIFAAIIRRNKGRQIAECHMFICNSTRDALHLVNASATANMTFKKQRGQRVEATSQSNDVIVVRSDVSHEFANNGDFTNGAEVIQTYTPPENHTITVESDVNNIQPKHYQVQQPNVEVSKPKTIYISFDKTNLVPKGDDTLQVTHTERQSQRTEEYSRPRYVEAPRLVPTPRPVHVPYVEYPTQRLRPIAPPQPPPRPMLVQRPLLVRPAPPPMMVAPPPPQRLYTKRFIAPPQPRFVSQPPIYYRSRARSASPIGRNISETRIKRDAYQPKWQGVTRPKSDVAAPRLSRHEQYERPPPPPPPLEFFQESGDPRAMHLNERAFSRRMHADNRIMPEHPAFHYPTAYELHDAMLYDRPTTKSNPKYSSSSSSSSDDGRGNRRRNIRR